MPIQVNHPFEDGFAYAATGLIVVQPASRVRGRRSLIDCEGVWVLINQNDHAE
jgi:hypothetical protein